MYGLLLDASKAFEKVNYNLLMCYEANEYI